MNRPTRTIARVGISTFMTKSSVTAPVTAISVCHRAYGESVLQAAPLFDYADGPDISLQIGGAKKSVYPDERSKHALQHFHSTADVIRRFVRKTLVFIP